MESCLHLKTAEETEMNRKARMFNEGVIRLLSMGYSPMETNEIMSHFVDICPECDRAVLDSPDAAARFVGGVHAVDKTELCQDESGTQYSVLWDDEGWRGGCGGGIRRSCRLGTVGWENF
jgi:hypothetical protein